MVLPVESYQTIYCLKIDGPGIIPGNILLEIDVPETIPGNILSRNGLS